VRRGTMSESEMVQFARSGCSDLRDAGNELQVEMCHLQDRLRLLSAWGCRAHPSDVRALAVRTAFIHVDCDLYTSPWRRERFDTIASISSPLSAGTTTSTAYAGLTEATLHLITKKDSPMTRPTRWPNLKWTP
jgi:hypothetical protein